MIGARRRGAPRPAHSATTAHFQAAYPFLAEGGLGAPGVYVGQDACGGAWIFDPWEAYSRRLVDGTCMLVLGKKGKGKSTFCKTYLLRQRLTRVQGYVLDPKGEYGPLARALEGTQLRLSPEGEVRINPIARQGGFAAQLDLLRSVVKATLHRDLTPEEDAGLRVGLERVNSEAGAEGEPTLPMVVDALLAPSEEMLREVSATSAETFAAANRDSALALQRLCKGDLKGMFDGPTTEGIDLRAPLVVIDLSAVKGSAALNILMTCAAAWIQSILAERKRAAEEEGLESPKLTLVLEEVWRVAGELGLAEWLQECFKLCRAWGIQVIAVAHRLTDFGAVGDAGSRASRILEGLVSDADVLVIFAQPYDQLELVVSKLGRSRTEAEVLPLLRRAEALWVVGTRSYLNRHRISQFEAEISYTDALMERRPDRTVVS
ncbi:MAG TPA: hypothetical protein VFJ61_06585 [Solirubrobacterales bacterium]|nr:hypothetical protein [Solirubrobacterales bacterium]